MSDAPENSGRKLDGTFAQGHKPLGGRPIGSRNKTTLACETLLDGKAKTLTKLAIARAEAGDMTALRLCLERIIPVRKERPTPFRLPPISGPADLPGIATSVLEAVADGSLTLGEGERICSMLDAMRGLYETADLAAQVDAMRADVEALSAQTQDWQES